MRVDYLSTTSQDQLRSLVLYTHDLIPVSVLETKDMDGLGPQDKDMDGLLLLLPRDDRSTRAPDTHNTVLADQCSKSSGQRATKSPHNNTDRSLQVETVNGP